LACVFFSFDLPFHERCFWTLSFIAEVEVVLVAPGLYRRFFVNNSGCPPTCSTDPVITTNFIPLISGPFCPLPLCLCAFIQACLRRCRRSSFLISSLGSRGVYFGARPSGLACPAFHVVRTSPFPCGTKDYFVLHSLPGGPVPIPLFLRPVLHGTAGSWPATFFLGFRPSFHSRL